MSKPPTKFAVLVSGSGTNLQALLDSQSRAELAPAQVELVISNVENAKALDRAKSANVARAVINHRQFGDRSTFEKALLEKLKQAEIEAVVLAGFMRVLSSAFLNEFPGRVINTHPSLCPAFPGLHAARQAIEYGAKVSGCTIHFVDEGVDTGPIIAQRAISVAPGDDEQSLQGRIQAEEHRLLPRAVHLLAAGRLHLCGRRVIIDGESDAFE